MVSLGASTDLSQCKIVENTIGLLEVELYQVNSSSTLSHSGTGSECWLSATEN